MPSVSPSAWPASVDADFETGDVAKPLDDGGAGLLGLLLAVAEILARALVDDDDGDRSQRLAVFAGERRIGERQHDEPERERANGGAAAARDEQQQRQDGGHSNAGPQDLALDERSERDTEVQRLVSYWPSRSSSAGTCTWSAL